MENFTLNNDNPEIEFDLNSEQSYILRIKSNCCGDRKFTNIWKHSTNNDSICNFNF